MACGQAASCVIRDDSSAAAHVHPSDAPAQTVASAFPFACAFCASAEAVGSAAMMCSAASDLMGLAGSMATLQIGHWYVFEWLRYCSMHGASQKMCPLMHCKTRVLDEGTSRQIVHCRSSEISDTTQRAWGNMETHGDCCAFEIIEGGGEGGVESMTL